MSPPATPRPRRPPRAASRPPSSSTPTSSRRPATPSRVGDRIEVAACTQAPYMDRDETARVLGVDAEQGAHPPDRLRRRLRRQARRLGAAAARGRGAGDRPAGAHRLHAAPSRWPRPPSGIRRASGRRRPPTRTAASPPSRCEADFNTGAYASWGPTVANRVPVHARGPYHVPNVWNRTPRDLHQRHAGRRLPRLRRAAGGDRARDADGRPRGARSGSTAGHIRRINALGHGDATPSGQVLDALRRPAGMPRRAEAGLGRGAGARRRVQRQRAARTRRGVGIACMWYGCGNTSLPNPSTMRIALSRDGRSPSSTARSISARARPPCCCRSPPTRSACRRRNSTLVVGDTDLTADAGKTSASRQTFVSGNAARLAALDLRAKDPGARQCRRGCAACRSTARACTIGAGEGSRRIDLATLAGRCDGVVLEGDRHLGPADHAARRERPGRALRHLRLCRADGGGRGRSRARHGEGAVDRRRARCRPRHQPDADRGPDPRRHRPGPRPGADGGVHPRPHREPARLSDPDRRRHAARSRPT